MTKKEERIIISEYKKCTSIRFDRHRKKIIFNNLDEQNKLFSVYVDDNSLWSSFPLESYLSQELNIIDTNRLREMIKQVFAQKFKIYFNEVF